MEKKLRIGMIGAGSIAKSSYLPVFSEQQDIELAAVMTKSTQRADWVREHYGFGAAVQSVEELAGAQPDCVFVFSPGDCHPEQAIFFLRQGIPVYCEKPMALTLREAAAMAEAAEKHATPLMIAFNRRFAPVYRKARQEFADRRPNVVIAQKNRVMPEYRGALQNTIHMVDTLRFFCGECLSVTAKARFDDPCREECTVAQLEFENGIFALLVADRGAGQWTETFELHGGGRSVCVSAPDSVTIVDAREACTTSVTPLANGFSRVKDKWGFQAAVDHFLHCVRTGETPITNAADAYKSHVLLDQILRAAGLPAME